jgi:membrane-bound serine protease (ClpP class)
MSAALIHLSPDAALALLTVGIFLIYLELNRPGSILPGAFGITAVLLAAAALARTSLNPSSILLIFIGMTVFARGIRRNTPSYLYAIATVCLLLGFLRLVITPSAIHIHWYAAAPCALLLGISTAFLTRIARRARRNKGLD